MGKTAADRGARSRDTRGQDGNDPGIAGAEPSSDDRAWTVERHLEGKPAASVELFRRFVALVEQCGAVELSITKTTITFKGVRRGFAGARPTGSGLVGYLDLQRVVVDPRITRCSPYTSRLFVHHFRVTAPEQLDETFSGWLREAAAVGAGAHLSRGPAPQLESRQIP